MLRSFTDMCIASHRVDTIAPATDWKLYLTVGIPTLAVIVGWFLSHWLTSKRELTSRKREARLKALERAYMRLATSSNREPTERLNNKIETFVSEIQLYGTPRQIMIMQDLVEAFKQQFKEPSRVVSFDDILTDLRDTIRAELKLEPAPGDIWWLRFPIFKKPAPNKQAPTEQS